MERWNDLVRCVRDPAISSLGLKTPQDTQGFLPWVSAGRPTQTVAKEPCMSARTVFNECATEVILCKLVLIVQAVVRYFYPFTVHGAVYSLWLTRPDVVLWFLSQGLAIGKS